ncbi:variable charge X-linked protein 3B-like [Mercenaria mercenaria]|uniref:variable charge X-linked protein 3B-like n=1 Tax=Mercenaria mercenaria TaxID=6596 RepID=UPI001E1D4B3A|nr:variable charge X-linked protein 3B-like [Mercenaria mercenaria]
MYPVENETSTVIAADIEELSPIAEFEESDDDSFNTSLINSIINELNVESPNVEPAPSSLAEEQPIPNPPDLEQPIPEQPDLELPIPKQPDLEQPVPKQPDLSPTVEPAPSSLAQEQPISNPPDLEQPIPKQSNLFNAFFYQKIEGKRNTTGAIPELTVKSDGQRNRRSHPVQVSF